MNESESSLSKETEQLVRSLLHKEGTWVDWGKACQKKNSSAGRAIRPSKSLKKRVFRADSKI